MTGHQKDNPFVLKFFHGQHLDGGQFLVVKSAFVTLNPYNPPCLGSDEPNLIGITWYDILWYLMAIPDISHFF